MSLNKAQIDFIIAAHKDRIESELELSSHWCKELKHIQDAFEKHQQQYDGIAVGDGKIQLEKFYGFGTPFASAAYPKTDFWGIFIIFIK